MAGAEAPGRQDAARDVEGLSDMSRQVIDENGAVHRLARRIGRGGQGEVWLVEGGRRVVKLVTSGRDPEALRRQLIFVRRLDLRGLHVARPIAVLRPPDVGYAAEFLDEMVALSALMEAPPESLTEWHIETGGLRRRLRLLAHAGEAIAGLHGRGVVFADVSHNNVFVSAPVHAHESWLIDLDNLAYDSDPARAIFTPGYGAPELVRGEAGCTSLSDAWAFAVLVWQTLTLGHPFVGDLVDDGPPELEERAFAAELPWVEHSEDDRNRSSVGLPPDLVLGSRLTELARRCFEHGLTDRRQRPSVGEWVERLHAAADLTLECAGCQGSYFVTEHACPWCDARRPDVDVVELARWVPDRGVVKPAARLPSVPATERPVQLTKRLTMALSGIAGRAPHVVLRRVDRGFDVSTSPGEAAWVFDRGAPDTVVEVTERGRLVPSKGWAVLFEPADRDQRVALLGGAQ